MRIVSIQIKPENTIISLQKKINMIILKMISKKVKLIIFPELSLNHFNQLQTKNTNMKKFSNYLAILCQNHDIYIVIGEEIGLKSIVHIFTPHKDKNLSFINSDLKQKKFIKDSKLFNINGINFRLINLLDLKYIKNNKFNTDIVILLNSGNPINFNYIKKKVKILNTYVFFSNICDKQTLNKMSGRSFLMTPSGNILTKLESSKEGLIFTSLKL